jgi:hypothetical protein
VKKRRWVEEKGKAERKERVNLRLKFNPTTTP